MAKIYVKNTDGTYTPQPSVLISNLDIVQDKGNSLTSAMSQKAVTDELTAKQDKLIPGDNITIKDGVISATGGITEETDPTVPQHVKDITEENITNWNNKSDFSGNYDDLENKPEIPSIQGLASEQYVQDEIGKIDIPSVEGLASETYVDEKVSSINIPDEVVIGTEEPTTDDWKIFIDESEEGPEYIEKDNVETEVIAESINPVSGGAVKTYVDTQIGNIETILTNIADESEAI